MVMGGATFRSENAISICRNCYAALDAGSKLAYDRQVKYLPESAHK
jgi:hypothetical protein